MLGGLLFTVTAVATSSLLTGLAMATLPIVVALTWRTREVPVFPFILGYQWVSVVVGHLYERWFGPLSYSGYAPGNLERTVTLSLAGLIVLAVAMRVGAGHRLTEEPDAAETRAPGAAWFLFVAVMLLYLMDYVAMLNPREYLGSSAIVEVVIGYRRLFLLALWYEVVANRAPRSYLVITFVWVMVPALGAYFSAFKDPVFMLLLVAVTFWRPWAASWWRTAGPRLAALVPVAFALLVVATAWQYGVKRETRRALDSDVLSARVADRAAFFLERTRNVLPELWAAPQDAVESLVGRLSYVVFFSRVLDHVPTIEPHAEGELLRMAVTNSAMPRFAFPDKPELPSDSYYTNRFAGVRVAERATSISIGYMAEFYADWGLRGMYLSIFGYGLWIGLVHRGIRRFVSPRPLVAPALVTVLLSMVEFEHQFIKGFAALNLGFIVIVGVTFVLRPWLTRGLVAEAPPRPAAAFPPEPLVASE